MERELRRTASRRYLSASLFVLLGAALLSSCDSGGGSASAPAALSSISITPTSAIIPLGVTQQFAATGRYSDGSVRDLTASVTWSSMDTAVASSAPSGLVTSVGIGSTTIKGAAGAISGSAILTVSAPALVSLVITPANPVLDYYGATRQFHAMGTYTDHSMVDLTDLVTWSSSDHAVALIGTDGFAIAVAISGSSTIGAQSGSISNSTLLSVHTANVSGQVSFPDSDMGWKPGIYDYLANGGGKLRVLGTDVSADVIPTSATTGTFTLSGIPFGVVTLCFDEGALYDVFTAASKCVEVNVDRDAVSGVGFHLVYHWTELLGYPAPWGTLNTQGPVPWKAQFVSADVAFIAFALDIPQNRVEIYRTLDRGANWTRIGQWIFDPTAWNTGTWAYPSHWQNFYFLDQNRGVLHATAAGIPCDSGGGYFFTADGGANWSIVPLPLTPTGYHVGTSAYARFGDTGLVMVGHVGCAVQGYNSGFYDAIWESADAGATWTLNWYSARDEWGTFIGVDANAAGRAVAYRGAQIQEFVLRDAQGNWTPHVNAGIRSEGRDIAVVGDTAWIVSVGGALPNGTYRSSDAGASWQKVSDSLLQDFDFVTAFKGFAQAGGPAYVTYDGGATWRYQSAGGAIWPGVMDIWAFDRTHAAWAETGFGDPNQTAQLFTYVEPWQARFEVRGHVALADANVSSGMADVPMASYRFVSNGPVPIDVQSLSLRASGTGNDAMDISTVRLWWDRNADGAVDAGDDLLASRAYPGDDATLSLSTVALDDLEQFHPVDLLVAYDFSAAAGSTGSFRLVLDVADIRAKQTGSDTTVSVTAPAGFMLTSRTVTVSP
ncbi:MAG TPA: Ig-like domain-containing protein [Planctomycetota bacterium]|nr:Ig-like domain-containing protein [Planctomycetota bacterium]HOE87351.1 Ig-like domain-containing protein [Planctomycetota bacterium]HOR67930.1 Ig-like domain-containing protein [Planctomycetota bacterium]HPL60871.1 Ig-like domain-containing protein [Planctomycetota bacterium]HQF66177.1 Ig-like domain-containing protein [Planctomycetota bacterium]